MTLDKEEYENNSEHVPEKEVLRSPLQTAWAENYEICQPFHENHGITALLQPGKGKTWS
jgi:hypothetical protein